MAENDEALEKEYINMMTALRDGQEELRAIYKEKTNLENESQRIVENAQKVVNELNAKASELRENIKNIEEIFKTEYARRLVVLEEREKKLNDDDAKNDERTRTLDKQQQELDQSSLNFQKQVKESLNNLQELRAANDAILADIATSRDNVKQIEKDSALIAAQIEKDKISVQIMYDQSVKNISEYEKLRNESVNRDSESEAKLLQDRKILKDIESIKHDNSLLLEEINNRKLENIESLKNIDSGIAEIEKKKYEVQVMLDEQNRNLSTIQELNERNKAEMIALRALQIELNAKDRESKERFKNLQALEAKIEL